MNAQLLVSHNVIINHLRNYRALTPYMLTDINSMTDFYKLKIIEEYDRLISVLLDILDSINDKSNYLNSIVTISK